MSAPLVTATRRGLVLVFYSEVLLVVGLLAFVLLPLHSPTHLLLGIVASLLVGAPAGLSMWAGRREFGPAHARNVPRGTVAFGVLALSLVLAYTQVDAIEQETLRVGDLWAPWFFLGLAIAADAAAMRLLVDGLVVGRGRLWLQAILPLGVVAATLYLGLGGQAVADLVARSGGLAANPAETGSYARDFVLRVVVWFASALLLLRVAFWPALYWSVTEVAQAEREAARRDQGGAPPAAP